MKKTGTFIGLLLFALTIPFGIVTAGIFNGGFELFDPNSGQDYPTPIGWERINYGASLEWMQPLDPTAVWSLPTEDLLAAQGNRFAMISSDLCGFCYERHDNVRIGQLRQQIQIFGDERISGQYFFGTYDYIKIFPNYNDRARITMIPTDPNALLQEIVLVQKEVIDVGNRDSMIGWERFSYVFSPEQAGTYDLVLEVVDVGDTNIASMLAVDDLLLCYGAGKGDLNFDCVNNYLDFEMLAHDWGKDCSDPNSNCLIEDLDGEGIIDIGDLQIYSRSWLEGERIDPGSL